MSRDRSNEWIGTAFFGIGIGAVGVAMALAWVSNTMGPASIPIWICVFGAGSYALRGPLSALTKRMSAATDDATHEIPEQVYAELDELRARLGELEERMDFSERVLTKGNDVLSGTKSDGQLEH